MKPKWQAWKPWLFILLLLGGVIFYFFGGRELLSFDNLQSHLQILTDAYQQRPLFILFLFVASYLLLTSLSIPGSLVLTLMAGAILGTTFGLFIVSLSGTIGALMAFLLSRYLLKDMVNQRFHRQVTAVNRNLESHGIIYLLSLRMIPVSPFVIINLVMGLTSMNWWTFFWTTLVGMIPGNLIYVIAGRRISTISSPSEIMTPGLIFLLTLLGILPWFSKRYLNWRRRRQISI